MKLPAVRQAIVEAGLAFRGAFHPPDETDAKTIVLVGFTGRQNWPAFTASPEAADNQPDPLDRWSRRVVTALAEDLGAKALFPFDGPPYPPFQRWARLAEPVHPSPLGILIHPDWGLWHAYRGALAFPDYLDLPEPDRRPSPCESCAARPCLSACPVGAFTTTGYNVPVCIAHIAAPPGSDCMDDCCRARRACPVGAAHRHGPEQAGFHMRAFRASAR
jgi:ferredoxin